MHDWGRVWIARLFLIVFFSLWSRPSESARAILAADEPIAQTSVMAGMCKNRVQADVSLCHSLFWLAPLTATQKNLKSPSGKSGIPFLAHIGPCRTRAFAKLSCL